MIVYTAYESSSTTDKNDHDQSKLIKIINYSPKGQLQGLIKNVIRLQLPHFHYIVFIRPADDEDWYWPVEKS